MLTNLPPEIICIIGQYLSLNDYLNLLFTCKYTYISLKSHCKLTKAAKVLQKAWKRYSSLSSEVRFKRKLFRTMSYNNNEITKIYSNKKWGIILQGQGKTINALTYYKFNDSFHAGVILGVMDKYDHLYIVNNSAEQVKTLKDNFDNIEIKRRKLNPLTESPFNW